MSEEADMMMVLALLEEAGFKGLTEDQLASEVYGSDIHLVLVRMVLSRTQRDHQYTIFGLPGGHWRWIA